MSRFHFFSYESLCRPLFFRLDPESAHRLVFRCLPVLKALSPLLSSLCQYRSAKLVTSLAGRQLANPVGLAAGFDKNALLGSFAEAIGFGFAEIGSITHLACAGNPKPRLFRLPADEALINRLGLNGDGASVVAERLARQIQRTRFPLGLNIDKTNDAKIVGEAALADVLATFETVKDLPVAYVVLNASCPNTHEGRIKETAELSKMLAKMQECNSRNLPLFIKLSPDSSDELLDEVVAVAVTYKVAGYVCGNTTTARSDLSASEAQLAAIGKGGLSGRPLKAKALSLCRRVYQRKSKEQEIIACGGIATGDDAYEFLAAGCQAVQIYTALVYHGPFVVAAINRRLRELLTRDGLSLAELSGKERLPGK